MREVLRRLRWMFRRVVFERDLDEELRFHVEMKGTESGNPHESRRQFGNVALLKEDSRAMWTFTFWEQLAQDLRYGLRAMAAHKLFAAMAVLSLALGIGANTAIYSFMDAIMLRALPVSHPEELVLLNWHSRKDAGDVVHHHSGSAYDEPGGWRTSPNYPYPAYETLARQQPRHSPPCLASRVPDD